MVNDLAADVRKGNYLKVTIKENYSNDALGDKVPGLSHVYALSTAALGFIDRWGNKHDGVIFHPVEITSTILEKFGFVNREAGTRMFDKAKYVRPLAGPMLLQLTNWYDNRGWMMQLIIPGSTGMNVQSIQYVHQLQNAFYALTVGQELKILPNE